MKIEFPSGTRLAAFSLFVVLAGCSTINELGKTEDVAATGYGYVAARIVSIAGPEPSGAPHNYPPLVRVYYKQAAAGTFSTSSGFTIEADLQNGHRTVAPNNFTVSEQTVLVRARPGQYLLSSLLGKSLGSSIEIPAKNSAPFTVKEGEVTYVGRIELITKVARNGFGTGVPGLGSFSVSDSFETDVAELKRRDPRLASMRITDAQLRQE